jgi:hypothetical protein
VWQIEATIANAKAVQALEKEGQSLADLLWSFQPKGSPTKPPASMSDIPTKTPEVACHFFFFLGLLEIYSLAFAPVRTLSLSLSLLTGTWLVFSSASAFGASSR